MALLYMHMIVWRWERLMSGWMAVNRSCCRLVSQWGSSVQCSLLIVHPHRSLSAGLYWWPCHVPAHSPSCYVVVGIFDIKTDFSILFINSEVITSNFSSLYYVFFFQFWMFCNCEHHSRINGFNDDVLMLGSLDVNFCFSQVKTIQYPFIF